MRSRPRVRFGRPVSGSCSAWCCEHLEREPGLGEVGDLQQRVPRAARLVGHGHQADRGVHGLAAGALVAALDVEALGPPAASWRSSGTSGAPSGASRSASVVPTRSACERPSMRARAGLTCRIRPSRATAARPVEECSVSASMCCSALTRAR